MVKESSSLCISNAIPISSDIEYDLHLGANLISFPDDGSVALGLGLPDEIEGSVSGLISEGVAAYNMADLGWMGSISAFNGGKGYWMITTEPIIFTFDVGTISRIKNDIAVTGLSVPEGKEIYQSTQQAFYFIEDIALDGISISDGDWILAYNGSTLVGARKWNGLYTDIPAMGNDGVLETIRYCDSGSQLTLKVHQRNTGKIYHVMDS